MKAFVIEHLEPVLSPWAYLEYEHAARFAPYLLVTNVRDEGERRCIERFAEALCESATEVLEGCSTVVLDPQAPQLLSQRDVEECDYVVVGGIMGDFPPRGRTSILLTNRMEWAIARSLGPCQFSVDGAVYIASRVLWGGGLEDVRVVQGVTVRSDEVEIHLPFCYPLDEEGRVFISEKLVAYMMTLLEEHEMHAAISGRPCSIAEYDCELNLPEVEYSLSYGEPVRLGDLLELYQR